MSTNLFARDFGDLPTRKASKIKVQDLGGYYGDFPYASPVTCESALQELGASHAVVNSTYARLDGTNQPFTDDVWLLESDLSASNVTVTNTASATVVDTVYIENSLNGDLTVKDNLIVDGTITATGLYDADADTSVRVESTPDRDMIDFYEGGEHLMEADGGSIFFNPNRGDLDFIVGHRGTLYNTIWYNAGTQNLSFNANTIFNQQRQDVDFTIRKETAGDAYDYNAGTDIHTFMGDVGIGTAIPATTLDIDSNSNTQCLRLRGADAANEIGDFYMAADSLLIDLTTVAAQFLDIRTRINSFGTVIRESDGTGTSTFGSIFVKDDTKDWLNIAVNADAGSVSGLSINQDGNVGIGTVGPNQRLEISTTVTNAGRIRITGTGTTVGAFLGTEFFGSGGNPATFRGGYFIEEANNRMAFWDADSEEMTMLQGGNFGIDIVAPPEALTIGNGGILQVNSAGDDKNVQLAHNDTDTTLTSSSGQINLVPASIVTTTGVIRGTTSLWYNEYHLGASQTSPGASGATAAELNAVFSWNLDAITEYLYYAADIHDDWDAATDVEIEVTGYLGQAETADDLIRMSILCNYGTDHDNANTFKTQTLTADHDIDALNAQFSVHTIPFTFNFDEGGNVLEIGDILHLRVYLDDVTTAPVVTDFNVTFVTIKYKSAMIRIEVD